MTDSVILWNTGDLGYLTVFAAVAATRGELVSGATVFRAGELGELRVAGDHILLGQPFIFNRDNIDRFDF